MEGISASLLEMVETQRGAGACLALFYVPTKENIYLPLALEPNQAATGFQGPDWLGFGEAMPPHEFARQGCWGCGCAKCHCGP